MLSTEVHTSLNMIILHLAKANLELHYKGFSMKKCKV